VGLTFQSAGKQTFNFSAWPYTQDHLMDSNHIHELVNDDLVTLNIDLTQKGVGGDVPAGGSPHDEYRLLAKKPLVFAFLIKPIKDELTDS
jgi:beta-galactosidase